MKMIDLDIEKRSLTRVMQLSVIILAGSFLLYLAKTLFIPLCMGLLVAIVMYPLCRKLEDTGISKAIAIGIVLGIVVILFLTLTWLIWYQLQLLNNDLPALKQKIFEKLPALQQWLLNKFSIQTGDPKTWLQNILYRNSANIGSGLFNFLNAAVGIGFTLFMVPIWAALFLYNRTSFVLFIRAIAGENNKEIVNKVLDQTVYIYYNYIKGVAQVYVIVSILNSVGLLALGIKHAVLFGMLTAIMTIIPYLGIIISALLPITVALLTKDSLIYPLAVIAVFSFVQYLEANVIFPKVVGIKLNVSTSMTLVGIIIGGILWGVSGMILFIPFVAVFKIISDYHPSLKALNILLKA